MAATGKPAQAISATLSSGERIEACLRRHGATRRPKLILEAGGGVTLMVPRGFGRVKAGLALRSLLPLLEAHLKKNPPKLAKPPEKIAVPLLDAAFTVSYIANEAAPPHEPHALHCDINGFKLAIGLSGSQISVFGSGDEAALICGLQSFFWDFAKRILPPFLESLAKGAMPRVEARNQRSVMGSCSKKPGRPPVIRLNWRSLLLPKAMLAHLCLHELAHLSHMSHGAGFYQTLEALSPDCRHKEKELSAAWKALPAWVFFRP